MKQDHIIAVLYDLALTASTETRVKPLLTKMTQRLLYHCAFPCGFFFSYSEQKNTANNAATVNAIIETSLCSRQLHLLEGQDIKISRIFCGTESKLITDKALIDANFPGNTKYDTALILAVKNHGAFILLSKMGDRQDLPLTRIFTPVLDNFSKTLTLCNQNEQFTNDLEKEIAERRKVEQRLSQFKKTMDMMHDCTFIIEPESMRFTYCNNSAVQKTGYSEEELLSMTPADIDPNNDLDAIKNIIDTVINGSNTALHFETSIRRKNGTTTPVNLTASYIAPQNEPTRVIVIAQDITEHKKSHNELLKAKNDAEQANQAKSNFLARMTHELRTPMNAILGFAQILQLYNINNDQREFCDEIIKAGNHLLELINDILDLSKIESGNINISMEELDLKNIIGECIPLVMPLARGLNITIDNQLNHEKGLCIKADFTRTKQVILNLLSNAIKYNRKNGSVCITAEHINNNKLRVNIIDTGSGITPELKDKLFVPFERLDAENTAIEGTGIGLNISKRLIEAMDGTIGSQNNLPEGSIFWFELNSCDEPKIFSPSAEVNNDNTPGKDAGQHTILYIEDNPANLRLMARIIKMRKDTELITAHVAAMGIDLARSHQPDIILMDISLPGNMDGFQALQALQRIPETKNIPVIAISANAMPRDIERGKQAGFYDYLAKPVNISQLNTLFDQLCGDT